MTPPRAVPAPASDERGYRLSSIDMLRGLVIVIMALDHVRDFFMLGSMQDPLADPKVSAALFATRWITHFCAPVFALLAGTSAGLMASRKSPAELGAFLLKRGIWLVCVDAFVISTALTFSPRGLASFGGATLIVLQILWAIGASMIVLAAAQMLGRRACLLLGAAILIGHNLLDPVWPVSHFADLGSPLWVVLHAQMSVIVGPLQIAFAYPLLPWTGVMLLGYGAAEVFELPAARRDVRLIQIGLSLIAAFVALRVLDVYGDPHHFRPHADGIAATLMACLNTTKYPPSLQYLLMTLGPAAVLCGYADRLNGAIKNALVMYGRVPFAFYVAHFYLIHALSVVLGILQGYSFDQMTTVFMFFPKGYGLPLAGVYAVWAVVVLGLYFPCRWMAGVKARRRDWWLSYL